ncbi:MAG: DUF1801 domain-containing protein [Gammaproteobacteria bacterium]
MRGIFRFPQARERSAPVEAWLDAQPGELGTIARTWFACLRRCGGDVRDLIHDGYPTACLGDAAFAYVGVFKAHVNVGFFHGAALDDPAGLLQGTGKYMRHVKIRPGLAEDRAAIEALIARAYRDITARLKAQP